MQPALYQPKTKRDLKKQKIETWFSRFVYVLVGLLFVVLAGDLFSAFIGVRLGFTVSAFCYLVSTSFVYVSHGTLKK